MAAVRLRDPDLQAKLAAVTRHEREVSHDESISQEQLVAMLIDEAHREMLAFHAAPTATIDSTNNQFTTLAMRDVTARWAKEEGPR
ncbi:hypothetical protein Haur_2055 [Herpetosiphon aurantiacus DSM 785]|uniref:Uncharacterized protein n=1 Tax=Herpetosiphon aurantiacus (strain ATCC 23779 / DSM 785 / 114-95) TaxID=316274 RepID=A9AVK5_HERA2|nr:hypothetical protein Haur_2055 [Herpetosiphon aurantiacus DSM 785]